MRNKTKTYWACQLSGWLGMVTIEMVNYTFFIEKKYDKDILAYFMLAALTGLILTHISRKVILRLNLFYKSALTIWVSGFVCTFAVSFLITIIGIMLSSLLYHGKIETGIPVILLLSYIINWMRYVGVWIIIYFLYKIMGVNTSLREEKLKVENAAKTAELELLKSQLNPHFLFNALNSIMALISIDKEKSRDAILLLSDLLRFTLNYGKERQIRLEDEITETKKYLQLEQIRFGSKLEVAYDIDENTLNALIPPASVLTLAENAIKHGRAGNNGLIKIVLASTVNNQRVEIKVKNTGKIGNNQGAKGLGVPIVKKRIEAIYGKEGLFSIDGNGDFVEAIIQIPAV